MTIDKPTSVFAKQARKFWPYVYEGQLFVPHLVGGTPSSPRVIEGWIKTNLGYDNERQIKEAVTEVMAEREVGLEEAASILASDMNLNGFKRTPDGTLYIEGRQLKACIKEAFSVAMAAGNLPTGRKWGETNKGGLGFVAEHVMVVEDVLILDAGDGADGTVKTPTGIQQRFVHTHRGSAIQYEEYVEQAIISFTVECDHKFTDAQWQAIWLTAERQGLGASRSQGFGRFVVTQWEQVAGAKVGVGEDAA